MVCGVPLYSASIAEVLLTTLPGEQWEAERELQRRMVNRLYREATSNNCSETREPVTRSGACLAAA